MQKLQRNLPRNFELNNIKEMPLRNYEGIEELKRMGNWLEDRENSEHQPPYKQGYAVDSSYYDNALNSLGRAEEAVHDAFKTAISQKAETLDNAHNKFMKEPFDDLLKAAYDNERADLQNLITDFHECGSFVVNARNGSDTGNFTFHNAFLIKENARKAGGEAIWQEKMRNRISAIQ